MDLYDVLLVTRDASPEEIEVAYSRRMAQLDRKGMVGFILRKLNFSENVIYAYNILSNSCTRKDYDRSPWKYRDMCDRYFGF
ncbi:hypothetical protein EET67_08460 [Pseudaminobacter arsenicus]|uniref:J domain-containing protein n=1 Tax=Borborobacter arsenicus TaxID=1851146 RepID=A0A432V7S5_9HYPH|nr:hypothetical protein EET67_08460 [Pseudaminobacter arsenicus]